MDGDAGAMASVVRESAHQRRRICSNPSASLDCPSGGMAVPFLGAGWRRGLGMAFFAGGRSRTAMVTDDDPAGRWLGGDRRTADWNRQRSMESRTDLAARDCSTSWPYHHWRIAGAVHAT